MAGSPHGRALWADSVSPLMNTITPHDQCKPIRIGENLVLNYIIELHEILPTRKIPPDS